MRVLRHLPRMDGIKSKWTLASHCQDTNMASTRNTGMNLDKLLNLFNSYFFICRLGTLVAIHSMRYFEDFKKYKIKNN